MDSNMVNKLGHIPARVKQPFSHIVNNGDFSLLTTSIKISPSLRTYRIYSNRNRTPSSSRPRIIVAPGARQK